MNDHKSLLEIACERAEKRKRSPEAFELKELFSREEWRELNNSMRRELGRDFSYAVSKGKIQNLRYDGESSQHHNMYLKI